jgi:uncharacterized coiled-coil DUF342 family protein
MNAERRKAIKDTYADLARISGMVDDLKTAASSLKETIEALRDEEQEFYDNMPESFQNGDKGSRVSEVIQSIDSAIDKLDEVDAIDFDAAEIESYLDDACGN